MTESKVQTGAEAPMESSAAQKKRIYPGVKRILDLFFSSLLILLLFVPMGVIALLVALTSQGQPFFTQKRVGKNKKLFTIIKFRTMYPDTDSNVPTHLLSNPEKCLTPFGKFLRKLSLDELPQLFNIFLGQMSFVGPRPALWNQFDLVAMRDVSGANCLVPGLTGWAQVNGRDMITMEEKVRLDGEYAEKISFSFDAKCLLKTVVSVASRKGIKDGSLQSTQEGTKKICMVTSISKAFNWFVSDSAKNFARKGFEVTVMCGAADEEFIKKHEKFAKVRPLPLVRGVNIPAMIKTTREMSRIFKEEHFDIIQYATPNASLCASLARGFKKIGVRVYGQWGLRYVGFTGFKRFFYKAIEKFICKRATNVMSTSPKNMEFAIEERLCPKEKIEVVGKGGTIGVDFTVYDISKKANNRKSVRDEYGIGEDEFVFGFVGRVNRDKGVGELLSAYRALLYESPETWLFLVGMIDNTDPLSPELLEWAESCDQVIITGNVNPKRVAEIMSAIDILVHPTYREGFSMVLQEAMAMALPIITTDVPGPSEVIEDGKSGVLVPAKSDKALLDEMKALMNDSERMARYSENGRFRAERYFARPIMLNNIYTRYSSFFGADSKRIKLMYLTSDSESALLAESAGADRIFLDLEVLGKEERHGHLDTVVSHSSLDDVKRLREAITKAELLVKCNPVHSALKEEIDRMIADGADIIMLPYFKTAGEVRYFLDCVGRRVRTVLLFETAEAVDAVDEILEMSRIDEAYIGLNGLHLSCKQSFVFEPLAEGTVDMLCEKFRARGIPYGFGEISRIGEGLIKSDDIIAEHKRLGSTCAILSRSFINEADTSRPVEDIKDEIALIRKRENQVNAWSEAQLEENRSKVKTAAAQIVRELKGKAEAKG
ncbi:MAG: aldolase/citrate lyase family protein [Ruminococcus sp.]